MFFLPSAVATIVPLGDFLIQFSTTFIHVSQNASSCNIMRLFMISKYHLLMYLPGQQSGSSAKLTEPEPPVAIPKCPAIHFYFLSFQISFCVFFFPFFFSFTAKTERKMLLAAGVQSLKRCSSRSPSSRNVLVAQNSKKFCTPCSHQTWSVL